MGNRVSTPKSLDDENNTVRALEQLAEQSAANTINEQQAGIPDRSASQLPVGATYSQAEMDALSSEVKAISDKLDTVLTALRASAILGS